MIGGLGRKYAPDARDRRFMLSPAKIVAIPTDGYRQRPWKIGPILDQGQTNQCTVYAAAQQLQSAPRLHALNWTPAQFDAIYRNALTMDEFPGEADEGTSERAVQKVLQLGKLVSEYLWAPDEPTVRSYLMTRGTLCFGCDWFTGMDTPTIKGAYVDPSGTPRGGHEFLLRWYYSPTHHKYPDTYECVNNWGEGWGEKGIFRMRADAFKYLFVNLNGDVCSPQEPKK